MQIGARKWFLLLMLTLVAEGCASDFRTAVKTPDENSEVLMLHGLSPAEWSISDGQVKIRLGDQSGTSSPASTGGGMGQSLFILQPGSSHTNGHVPKLLNGTIVGKGDPYLLRVNTVYLPDSYERLGKGEVVVTLDMQMEGRPLVRDLAVAFQVDYPGKMALNFKDTIVYSTNFHDPHHAPYLRIKVTELDKQEALKLQGLLGQLGDVANALGSYYPNPYVPAIQLGLKVGELLAQLDNDDAVMDYEFMWDQAALLDSNGETADGKIRRAYAEFREGLWVAIGMPNEASERKRLLTGLFVWDNLARRLLWLDAKHISKTPRALVYRLPSSPGEHIQVTTQNLALAADLSKFEILDLPVVVMELQRVHRATPAIIQERTAEVAKLLESNKSTSPVQIEELTKRILSAARLDEVLSLLEQPSVADMNQAFKLIGDGPKDNPAKITVYEDWQTAERAFVQVFEKLEEVKKSVESGALKLDYAALRVFWNNKESDAEKAKLLHGEKTD